MANLTVSELKVELRYMLGSDTDEDSPRLEKWLRFGYDFITFPNVYKHPELEYQETVTLVAGDTQSTTAVWNAVELVRYFQGTAPGPTVNGWRLYPTSYRLLQERSVRVEGPPKRYSFRGNQFILDTSVDSTTVGNVIVVAGYRKPAPVDWSDDTETTDLREEWDEILLLGAAMYGHNARGEYEKAHGARDSLGRLINDMPPIQAMSAVDWDHEMIVTGGPGDRRAAGAMRVGRGR